MRVTTTTRAKAEPAEPAEPAEQAEQAEPANPPVHRPQCRERRVSPGSQNEGKAEAWLPTFTSPWPDPIGAVRQFVLLSWGQVVSNV